MMRLHVFPPSPRAIKVLAVRNYLELDCEVRVIDYFRQEQKSEAFGVINPNLRMPVLEDNDFVLWESNAIAFYLASKKPGAGLWPSTIRDQADVLRWLAWEDAHWTNAIGILLTERVKKGLGLSPGPLDPLRLAEGITEFEVLARILDQHLAGRSWLIGERLTIADFTVACWLTAAKPGGYEVTQFNEISRWFDAMQRVPGWRTALPNPANLPASSFSEA
jgi:glutathione S-transferase